MKKRKKSHLQIHHKLFIHFPNQSKFPHVKRAHFPPRKSLAFRFSGAKIFRNNNKPIATPSNNNRSIIFEYFPLKPRENDVSNSVLYGAIFHVRSEATRIFRDKGGSGKRAENYAIRNIEFRARIIYCVSDFSFIVFRIDRKCTVSYWNPRK